ncbi:MAG: arabinofuranosyltransferase, partial [Candidatus Hermodarchaeota archaeon]
MSSQNLRKKFSSIFNIDIIQELFYSAIGCILFFIIYNFFPNRYWDYIYKISIILILALIFFLIFVIVNQTSKKNFFKVNYKRNIILFSIVTFAAYLFIFYNTNWGYNGTSGDNVYRTAYITQMAHSGIPQDFGYKGLSAFYSPFYWYCLALISLFFQIPPYKMIRIGFLISCWISPIILFEFWKKIYEEKLAFTITIFSSIYLISVYSPDHMFGAFLFIPYFIYYFENFTNKKFTKREYLIGGIIGSIAFCTFFYYFLIVPIYYFISLIQDRNEFRKKFKHLLYSIILLLLFSIWFWGPLLKDIILIGFESHQNNYFGSALLSFPLINYIGFGVWGVFNTIGLLYIIKNYKTNRDIKIFGNLLISIHILALLGLIGILIHFPIMHERIYRLSNYIMVICSSIFYIKFFYFIKNNKILVKNNINIDIHQIEILLILILMTAQNISHWAYVATSEGYEAAREGAPTRIDKTRDIIEELDYEDKVFLMNDWEVSMYLPIYLFLSFQSLPYKKPYQVKFKKL